MCKEIQGMNKKAKVHFLWWQRFKMACGKRPHEIKEFSSRWSSVTCKKCLEREALGEVEG